MSFCKDDARTRKSCAAENLAIIRRVALDILRAKDRLITGKMKLVS